MRRNQRSNASSDNSLSPGTVDDKPRAPVLPSIWPMNLSVGGVTNGETTLRYHCAPDLRHGSLTAQQANFTPRTLLRADATVFFDVGYRIVAIALSVSCGRQVWHGLVEQKIRSIKDPDILNWLLDWSRWSRQVFHRDSAPVRYWMEVSMQTGTMVLCFVAAIIGWQPSS